MRSFLKHFVQCNRSLVFKYQRDLYFFPENQCFKNKMIDYVHYWLRNDLTFPFLSDDVDDPDTDDETWRPQSVWDQKPPPVRRRHHFPLLLSLLITGNLCCGSITFWCRSGSADPCFWLMDPDPFPSLTFKIKMPTKNKFFKKFFSILLSKVLLHHFSKVKS